MLQHLHNPNIDTFVFSLLNPKLKMSFYMMFVLNITGIELKRIIMIFFCFKILMLISIYFQFFPSFCCCFS